MISLNFFIKGLIIGFVIAIPLGPISLFSINNTLAKHKLAGFVTGLGAVAADVFYATIAGFSITFIYNFIIAEKLWFRLLGGLFLVYLGWRMFFSKPAQCPVTDQPKSLKADFLSTFFLAVTNPLTIFFFLAIFAALGIGQTRHNHINTVLFIIGIFCGSSLWWLLLINLADKFKEKVSDLLIKRVNKISGAITVILGLIILLMLLYSLWVSQLV